MALTNLKPVLLRLLYVLVVLAALPLLIWNGFIQQISTDWNDLIVRIRGTLASPTIAQVVLAAIDDRTAARYGPLPLDRGRLAEGLEILAQAHPRVLVLDLLIAEPGDPQSDERLVRAVRQFPKVVLGAALESDTEERPRWILPLPHLVAGHSVAHVHAAPDADGDVRSVLLLKEGAGRRFWALGLEAVRLALSSDRPLEASGSVVLGAIHIPAPERDSRWMAIHYAGPEGSFPRVSFGALLDGTANLAAFRDKIVILGATAQGSGDRFFTPFSTGIGMSGIEIHANVARTILDRAFLVPLGVIGEFAGSLLLVGLSVVAVVRLRGMRLFLTLLAVGLSIAAASFLALRVGYVLPLGSFLAVFLLASATAGTSEYALVSRALAGETTKRKEYAFRVQAIAHEIKTPLTAIQGSSEMISEGWVPERQRAEMAGLIHKESKRLTSLIQTFLNVERLAAGALSLQKQEVDLGALCEDVVERCRLYAARKRIRVDAAIPEIHLLADPDLLSFAIYNLVTNGVKYSPRNTTVVVSAEDDGTEVRVSVADQGYGIGPADREKIFEKFYRLKRDEKGAEEGTGIGLALVKEIVQQHGGRISVESRPNAGSRFTIALPKG
ncbi:MAG: CHASE2 domain-containing protein [Bryobacterales bacterium]|nr:CHASE2 domain-containing protein [Bryobacterales bacterium]